MAEKGESLKPEKAGLPESAVAERTKDRRSFIPNVDITEKGHALMIHADMPGADEKSVNITLENDVLTIEAQVKDVRLEGHTLSYAEYEEGDYYRAFTLNENVDRDKIEASLKNGVLSIVLPKAEEAKTKTIPIKVG
ncbi:MAG TPA: Hsp20/alpha crystallin family protein [Deltaproteobacteria bacterium]|nr:Hsp20/alpha crystallin family protein [Deltaproteobacteria bacterium]